jgi:hypothetical protein
MPNISSDVQKKLEKHDDEIHGLHNEIHGLRENVTKVAIVAENLNEKMDLVNQRVINDVAILRESNDKTATLLRHDTKTQRVLIQDIDERVKALEESKAERQGFEKGAGIADKKSQDRTNLILMFLSCIAAALVCYVTVHEYINRPASSIQQTVIKSN